MRFAVVSRITSYSCTKRPTAFHEDASSSDRELMAPPIDSSFVRPRGTDTWPIGARSGPSRPLDGVHVTRPRRRPSGGKTRAGARTGAPALSWDARLATAWPEWTGALV